MRETKGKRCDQIIEEMKKIKRKYLDSGRTVTEIKSEHPDYLVWSLADSLSPDAKEVFWHPKQWGPIVGYAQGLLADEYGNSKTTVRDWCKEYRRSVNPRMRKNQK
jgi:hypothetical protein